MPSSLAWWISSFRAGISSSLPAVDHVHVLGAHALGAAGGVHGHVAAAHDGGGPVIFLMGVS